MATFQSRPSFSARSALTRILRGRSGVTLTELMIAMAILSVGILGFIGAFNAIGRSLHVSRTRTLAANLAQEKIEVLKNNTYYGLLVTTAAATIDGFDYDTGNYPPETISIGGITFTRYTYVSLAQMVNGVVTPVSYTSADGGLKGIQVHVVWNDHGSQKVWTLTNLFENPNVEAVDVQLYGYVYANGSPLGSAIVRVEQNPDWVSTTNASGYYSFSVGGGTWTVRASSAGYYDSTSTDVVVTAGQAPQLVPSISLEAIATGTVTGEAWMNPNIVISQVMASTAPANNPNFDVQFVELYNPTTAAVTIGTLAQYPNEPVQLNFDSKNNARCSDIQLTYVNTTIPSYGYYLIANTATFTLNGAQVTADAYYTHTDSYGQITGCGNSHCNCGGSYCQNGYRAPCESSDGDFYLTDPTGDTIDSVGWTKGWGSSNSPNECLGTCFWFNNGFPAGEQLVRISSPAASFSVGVSTTYGRAYDSQVNQDDFYPNSNPIYNGGLLPAYTAASGTRVPITGVPAVGAFIDSSDPFSGSTQAYLAYIASGSYNLPYAPFQLVGVGTSPVYAQCNGKCWSLEFSSGSWYTLISTVAVQQGVSTGVPSGSTVPSWVGNGLTQIMLDTTTTNGFISGQITDVFNNPIPTMEIIAGNVIKNTNGNGYYFASVSSGTITLVVNPNNADSNFISQTYTENITTLHTTTQDVALSNGGQISGSVTNTSGGSLPNMVFYATLSNNEAGQATSNSAGQFTLHNLSTGTYVVQPVLGADQASAPASQIVTLTSPGATVGTTGFVISGADGTLSGSVSITGTTGNLTTGALILASTGTLPTSPSAIYASSSAALSPILFAASSKADGTYSLSVASGTYNVCGYYPVITGNGTVTTQHNCYSGVGVSGGGSATKNLILP